MSFEQECLDAHNTYRKDHGVPPLKLSSAISKECRKFAQVLVKEGALRNSKVDGLGENIFSLTSSNKEFMISGSKAVDHWYTKSAEHDYSHEPSPGSTLSTGNFSQMVWKGSKELGVGFAQHNGKIVVVARYSPQGNIIGRFQENVLPVKTSGTLLQNVAKFTSDLKASLSGSQAASKFNLECLHAHNQYRSKHGVPELRLDAELCNYSQEWAENLARIGKMQHRPQADYGENIFSMWSSNINFEIGGAKAVESWYAEIACYPFGREPTDLKAGHFSQIVWKGSQKLGVGVAKREGNIYVVCNYFPPGNYVGNYTANVPARRN